MSFAADFINPIQYCVNLRFFFYRFFLILP